MPVPHRKGNVYYTSYLPPSSNDEFDDYDLLDIVSHVTTIENAISIIRTDFSPSLIYDYSIVSQGILENRTSYPTNHPLHYTPVIWLSPSAEVPIEESRYGNVAFSTDFVNLNVNVNFYYIEIIKYQKSIAVRLLLTNDVYPELMELNPLDTSSPVCFNPATERWYFAQTLNSERIMVELITDFKIAFPFVSYTRAPRQRPRVQKSEIDGYFPIFIDNSLGYLFYCIIKQLINTDNQYADRTGVNNFYNELISHLELLDWQGFDCVINETVDGSQNPDDIVNKLRLSRVFQPSKSGICCYHSYPDTEDIPCAELLYTLFINFGKMPSPAVCVKKFFKGTNRFVQLGFGDKLVSIDHLMSIFLNHFDQDEGKIIKDGIQYYVAEAHGRQSP